VKGIDGVHGDVMASPLTMAERSRSRGHRFEIEARDVGKEER
jgi:hypothetical protein